MLAITSFKGKYRFLSNFYPAKILYRNIEYPTVEHAYQAVKTVDKETRRSIASLATPGDARRAGQNVVLRANWGLIRVGMMDVFIRKKFMIPDLERFLLATEDRDLVEGNYWGDTFWGVCKGVGQNQLGKLLMQIRKEKQ